MIAKCIAALFSALSLLPVPKEKEIAITAHRGFWTSEDGGFSQNSLASLRAARDYVLWGSEFDIHLTADDVIIVTHDRTQQGLDIQKVPYEDLSGVVLPDGEGLPTLDDYLSVGGDLPVMVCELKPHDTPAQEDRLIDLTLKAFREHGLMSPDRVIFISFSHHICQRLCQLAPGFTVQYLEGDLSPRQLLEDGINGIDYHFSKFDAHPEWVAEAHELGMEVNVWTVDEEADILRMLDLGVDCITTNEPLRVREILSRTGRKEKSRTL